MNAYDSDRLNEAEMRAEHAEEQVRWLKEDLEQVKAREAKLREALADSNRLLLAITLGPNYSDNEIRGQIYDNSKALEKVTP